MQNQNLNSHNSSSTNFTFLPKKVDQNLALSNHNSHFRVSCDGADQASTHPKIYLSLEGKDIAVCPYCSRVFKQNH